MTREIINNGESGLSARNKLNSNFQELYAEGITRAMPQTLVLFGSSNVAGAGASSFAGDPTSGSNWASPATSWAGLLTAALPGWTVFNRSISGSSTGTSISRFYTDCAVHRPSHVLLATGIANNSYNPHTYLRETARLVSMVRSIGAIPIIRTVYPHNAMTAAQYQAMLQLNAALANLGCPIIDHMSTLDNGSGGFIGGSTYHSGDGQHLSDAGNVVFFNGIDLSIFTAGVDGLAPTRPFGAWTLSETTNLLENGLVVNTASGLAANVRSFTMRCRMRGWAGMDAANIFMGAYTMGSGLAPLRLRNANSPFDVADANASVQLIVSTITPNNTTLRDLVLTYNQATDLVSLYIDGTLISAPAAVSDNGLPVPQFAWAGNPLSPGSYPNGFTMSDVGLWNVPLSAREISAMALNNRTPVAGRIFAADLSGPAPVSQVGLVPNLVGNGVLATIGANWTAVAA